MRAHGGCVSLLTLLVLASLCSSRAQQIVDFAQVEVGLSSVRDVDWRQPSHGDSIPGWAVSVEIDAPYPPFYLLEYGLDTTGGMHVHFQFEFRPDSVGLFMTMPVHCSDANGNPTNPDSCSLTLRGGGTLTERAQPQLLSPSSFSFSAYPNPFNAVATIAFTLPQSGNVEVEVYDLLGRHVAELINGHRTRGTHSVLLDGAALPSGLYFVRLSAGSLIQTQKVMLLK